MKIKMVQMKHSMEHGSLPGGAKVYTVVLKLGAQILAMC